MLRAQFGGVGITLGASRVHNAFDPSVNKKFWTIGKGKKRITAYDWNDATCRRMRTRKLRLGFFNRDRTTCDTIHLPCACSPQSSAASDTDCVRFEMLRNRERKRCISQDR